MARYVLEEHLAEIQELRRTHTLAQIGKAYGVSRQTVANALARVGQPPRSRTPLQPCGTYAAYQRHRKNHEEIDPACRAANAAYTAIYRATGGNREREVQRNNATTRALWRLADRHREEYEALRVEELLASEATP